MPKALLQERELKALVPDVEVEMDVGRASSFEVVVDDRFLAYSKLACGSFPNFKALAAEIAAFAASKTAPASWAAVASS